MGHDLDLLAELLARAERSGLNPSAQRLVAAAAAGADALDSVVAGGDVPPLPVATSGHAAAVPMFLSSIEVSGFRGIATPARLGFKPVPGLTLVVGRNGSGKSSFVEAAEVALTASSSRWVGKKNKLWKDGWANVHHDADRAIELKLQIEGDSAPTVIRHGWKPAAASPESAESSVQRPGGQREPLSSLGVSREIESYRPILSYSELGNLLEEGPSKLYDAVSNVLGLKPWVEVKNTLEAARKAAEQDVKDADNQLKVTLRPLLEELVNDERAAAVLGALAPRKTWALDEVEALVTGVTGAPGDVGALQELVLLPQIDAAAIVARANSVRDTARVAVATEGTDAGRALELAGLLRQALQVHAHADSEDCPVCGRSSVLDDAWVERTRSSIDELESAARDAQNARRELANAVEALRGLVANPPQALRTDVDNVDTASCLSQWIALADARGSELSPVELADALEVGALELVESIGKVRADAQAELERKSDKWQPIAARVAAWIPLARRAVSAKPQVADLKAAEAWVADETLVASNERFQPIRSQVLKVWNTMRHTSNVALDDVVLTGKNTKRSVDLQVSVDGSKTAALSVMSQGELNTLALSLFLPRATLEASPFKFMLVDDPVQSMDAARVDGLARVLADVAATHQVIVFTHDERLPEACRRLDLGATVFEVTRGDRSEVSVRRRNHPVFDYLDDANAVMKSQAPEAAKLRVVPGLCRNAIEAAADQRARERLITGGMAHTDVDELAERALTTMSKLGLALFGDLEHNGDVLPTINRLFGADQANLVQTLKKGAHGVLVDNLDLLISDTKKLADGVMAAK